MTSELSPAVLIIGGGPAGLRAAAELAPHLRDGVLVVVVTDPAWATQLRFLEAELIAKIADRFGRDEVTKVEVRMRSAPAQRSRGRSTQQ